MKRLIHTTCVLAAVAALVTACGTNDNGTARSTGPSSSTAARRTPAPSPVVAAPPAGFTASPALYNTPPGARAATPIVHGTQAIVAYKDNEKYTVVSAGGQHWTTKPIAIPTVLQQNSAAFLMVLGGSTVALVVDNPNSMESSPALIALYDLATGDPVKPPMTYSGVAALGMNALAVNIPSDSIKNGAITNASLLSASGAQTQYTAPAPTSAQETGGLVAVSGKDRLVQTSTCDPSTAICHYDVAVNRVPLDPPRGAAAHTGKLIASNDAFFVVEWTQPEVSDTDPGKEVPHLFALYRQGKPVAVTPACAAGAPSGPNSTGNVQTTWDSTSQKSLVASPNGQYIALTDQSVVGLTKQWLRDPNELPQWTGTSVVFALDSRMGRCTPTQAGSAVSGRVVTDAGALWGSTGAGANPAVLRSVPVKGNAGPRPLFAGKPVDVPAAWGSGISVFWVKNRVAVLKQTASGQ